MSTSFKRCRSTLHSWKRILKWNLCRRRQFQQRPPRLLCPFPLHIWPGTGGSPSLIHTTEIRARAPCREGAASAWTTRCCRFYRLRLYPSRQRPQTQRRRALLIVAPLLLLSVLSLPQRHRQLPHRLHPQRPEQRQQSLSIYLTLSSPSPTGQPGRRKQGHPRVRPKHLVAPKIAARKNTEATGPVLPCGGPRKS